MTIQDTEVRELGRLLTDVSAEGMSHLDEVQADLAQTRLLLTEAIERLSAGFSALHSAVAAQSDAAQALKHGAAEADCARLHAAGADIEQQVRAMVTALQFEDMTSQLIAHAGRRVAGLRSILADMVDGARELAAGDLAQMERLRAMLAMQSRELDCQLMRSVDQRHMESGDITLF